MSRRTLALVVLVVAAGFAGCSALSGGTADGEAAAIAANATDEMATVDTYRIDASIERTSSGNNQEKTVTESSTGVFDRSARAFRVSRTASNSRQTVETDIYLVNGTLYERNPNYERVYGSAWVKSDVSENLTRTWRAQDTLTRQRILLENATSVEYEGTETVNGTETHVLAVDGDEAAFESTIEGRVGGLSSSVDLTVEAVSATHYVSTATDRLRRATTTIELSIDSGSGSISQTQELTLTFSDYGTPVDVTLPEGASVAVNPSNTSA